MIFFDDNETNINFAKNKTLSDAYKVGLQEAYEVKPFSKNEGLKELKEFANISQLPAYEPPPSSSGESYSELTPPPPLAPPPPSYSVDETSIIQSTPPRETPSYLAAPGFSNDDASKQKTAAPGILPDYSGPPHFSSSSGGDYSIKQQGSSRSYKEEVQDSIQAVKVSRSSPKNKKKIAYLRRKEATRNKARKSIKRLKNTHLSLKRNRSQKNKNQYGYHSKKKYSRIKNKKNSKRKRSQSSSNQKGKKKRLIKKTKSLKIQQLS